MEENGITALIVIICLIIAILIKGVTVTDESKNIVNEHMTWIEFYKTYNK